MLLQAAAIRRLHSGRGKLSQLFGGDRSQIVRCFATDDGKSGNEGGTEGDGKAAGGESTPKQMKRGPKAGKTRERSAKAVGSSVYKPATPVTIEAVLESGEYIDDGFVEHVASPGASNLEQIYKKVQQEELI